MSADEARKLVASVLNEAKAQPLPPLSESKTVGDLRPFESYKNLTGRSEEIWKVASQNLNLVAPTPDMKAILFDSFEGLSPESYLQFLNKTLAFYQNQIITHDNFVDFILLPGNNQQLFLPYNYQDPRVHAFLLKVKSVFASDPNMASSVDHILSGKMKIAEDERRADESYLGKQPIPLLEGTQSHVEQTPMATTPSRNEMRPSQPVTLAKAPITSPIVTQATVNAVETSSQFPFGWIVAGAIVLMVGGWFAWKKLS